MSNERAHEFVEADFGGGEQVGDEEEFGEENEVREGDEFVAENEVRGGEEFGAENELDEDEEESYSVENNGETMSVSSSNKRIKHMSIDRLSALPDSVLIHILSFLNVNEAAVTSVLSKRWRFLWTESHRLIFKESSSETEKIREFVTRIHKTLINRSGSNLEEFEVNFNYDKCFASDVNVWVEYAVKNNVKKLLLLLKNSRYLHRLPQLIYSNSSFTELWMLGCIVDPRRTIDWRFLTSLSLEKVELSQHVIDKIFSSCPVLNSLLIGRCWGFSRLEINSQSLDEILVIDIEDGKSESLVEISVPYLRTLAIWQYPNRRQSRIIKVPSVVRAGIALNGSDWDAGSEEVMSNMKELFENLQHVKQLMVGNMCIQLLQSRVGNLEVYASRDEHIIPGTVGLLESPPSLEKLVIQGFEPEGASVTWGPVARSDLHCDLFHLKTVDILDYANPNFGSEPLLALARILLKKAKVLEKMVIDVELEETTFLSGHASFDFIKVAQALLSYPRSSEKAEVILR